MNKIAIAPSYDFEGVMITHNKGLVYGKVLVDDYPDYILSWLEWRPRGLVIMMGAKMSRNSRHKKPAGKHTLTLHFDSEAGVQNFIAWYLDGGGEQQSHYYNKGWGDNWIYVKPPETACKECEYFDPDEPLMQGEECGNCGATQP